MEKSKKIPYAASLEIKWTLIFALISVSSVSFAQKLKWTVYHQNTKAIYTETGACPSDYPKKDEEANYYCSKNYAIKVFDSSIKLDNVNTILQQKNSDSIWFSSGENGVACSYNGEWKRFTTQNSALPSDNVVKLIQKDNFGVLASTPMGIYYIGDRQNINNNFINVNVLPPRSLCIDKNNSIWIGYAADGLWKSDASDYSQWTNLDKDFNGPDFDEPYPVNFIHEHSKTGNIWIRELNLGVFEYNGVTWNHHDLPGLNNAHIVNPIYEDSYGNLWLGTSEGLYFYDGSVWKELNSTNTSFRSNSIKCVFEDSRKNIWVMTDADISVYDRTGWLSYDMPATIGNVSSYRQLMAEDASGKIFSDQT